MPKSSKPRRTRGADKPRIRRTAMQEPRKSDPRREAFGYDPRAHSPRRGDGRPHRFPGRAGGR